MDEFISPTERQNRAYQFEKLKQTYQYLSMLKSSLVSVSMLPDWYLMKQLVLIDSELE